MLVPVYDIMNCGPRSRFAANGKIVHNSKGSAINMQNLKRGSFLRKSIMAPVGHQLVVGDLSQIEPRVLAWLSDYDEMLDIFRAGGDPYAAFGAKMFSIPGMTKDTHPVHRQSAKSALLGCFGSQTPVLTKRGWVTILDVTLEDTLWDGTEWVTHQGLLPQGEKEVLTAHGISATSDHEILTEHGWVEWHAALANHTLLASALSSANLPVLDGNDDPTGPSGKEKTITNQKSQPLKQRMQTYDIAYVGPRNRYTVLTSEGPIIVHNCGYGLGWASFAAQLLVGFLGAPPLRYTKADAIQLGVTQAYVQKFLDWDDNVAKMIEIPHLCTDRELLIHCVAAKKIIDIYRETAYPVKSFWDMLTGLMQTAMFDGAEHTHKCLTFRKDEIELPNGMKLLYPNLRKQKNVETKKDEWVYGTDATKLYAGKIANNVTQATARIVMTDGMLRVSKKYFVAGTVHDEQIVVVPDEEVEFAKTWVLAQMTMEPKYLRGIPLDADGGAHRRYGLAKG